GSQLFVYVAKAADGAYGVTCSLSHESPSLDPVILDATHRGAVDSLHGEAVQTSATSNSKSTTVKGNAGHLYEIRTIMLRGIGAFTLTVFPAERLPLERVEPFLKSIQVVE